MSDALMDKAGNLLNKGRTWDALHAFYDARDEQMQHSADGQPSAEVMQMIAICCRMLRYYRRADEAFETAYALAYGNDKLRGKILRDWAMLSLVQREYHDALARLEGSLELLIEDPVEHATSLGFRARVHGKMGNREQALKDFQEANEKLRGRPPYELNNLVWWLKYEPDATVRRMLSGHAWHLAKDVKNRKRQAQIVLLLVRRPPLRAFSHEN
jgi:tetratricopeptide (TPR) repeat protein